MFFDDLLGPHVGEAAYRALYDGFSLFLSHFLEHLIGHDRKQLCHGLRDLSHGILWVVHPFPLLFMFMKILWITEKV